MGNPTQGLRKHSSTGDLKAGLEHTNKFLIRISDARQGVDQVVVGAHNNSEVQVSFL
jgi:glutaredoxin 2